MKKSNACLWATLFFCAHLSAQIVNIPDANFKAALVGNPAINTNGDGEIQVAEAQAYEGGINVANRGISLLTGIEAFPGIDSLNCAGNQVVRLDLGAKPALVYLNCAGVDRRPRVPLEHLDLSGCPALVHLICSFSRLGNLDLSANPALVRLECFYSYLTSLDLSRNSALEYLNCSHTDSGIDSLDLSGNPALTYLNCGDIYLTKIDLSGNPALTHLYCGDNNISNLDLSGNPVLTYLDCSHSDLGSLDISANVNLKVLDCHRSRFDTLDLSGHPSLETFDCSSCRIRSLDVSFCPALKEVDVEHSRLQSLNVDSTPALERLNCSHTGLTSLDVSSSPALRFLNCKETGLTYLNLQNGNNTNMSLAAWSNPLECVKVDDPQWAAVNWRDQVDGNVYFATDCEDPFLVIPDANFKAALLGNPAINTNGDSEIQVTEAEAYHGPIEVAGLNIANLRGIEGFIAIDSLDCSNNQLTNLDITSNQALVYLNCSANQLTSLNVRANPLLASIHCSANQLSGLDTYSNLALNVLDCSDNQLVGLYLSMNPLLESLDCSDNPLVILDVQNGNNVNFTHFDARGNPELSCIKVDDPVWAAANWSNVDPTTNFGTDCVDKLTVFIPDANFKAPLVNDLAINTNHDGEIQVSEAQAYTGSIIVGGRNIGDLTGIEAFIAITSLDCNNNQLASLDVSSNPALETLECYSNQLASLDVSANLNLAYLECGDNQLTSLDLSAKPALEVLSCGRNQLTSLNVSASPALVRLNVADNRINDLDLSSNPALKFLHCAINRLTSLDVSLNPVLHELFCLDNQLTSLDVSLNPGLVALNCSNNQLISLNIQNGASFWLFTAQNNPNLSCVQVDNVVFATANWSEKVDPGVTFSTDCPEPIVYIPDANFKAALVGNPAINTNGDGEIQVAEAQAYDGAIHVASLNIADLTGIEAFTGIDSLDCANNALTSLDLSANPALEYLNCSNADLRSLDVSSNPALTYLNCSENYSLSGLNLSANPALTQLRCIDIGINNLDLSANPALTHLYCEDNPLSSLDLSANSALTDLFCSGNNLSSLDLSANSALTKLICSYNDLSSLDLSANLALTDLTCSYNDLSSLDLSMHSLLSWLNCSGNQLTSLNIQNGANTHMGRFDARWNPNLSCIQVDDPIWAANNWTSIDAHAAFSTDCTNCADIGDADGDGVCVNVDCDDDDPNIAVADVDGDGLCADVDCNDYDPDIAGLPGDPCEDGDPNTQGETIQPDCNCGGGVVPISTCSVISAGADDAEERTSTGVTYIVSTDIELIDDPLHGGQTIGLRFTGLDIPPGSVIVNAYIQFTVDETTDIDPCHLSIYGEAADNAAAFDSIPLNITTRLRTGNSVAWAPGAWPTVGEAGADQRTPDISAVLQEIVNRAGYTATSAIVIMIEGTGRRTAVSFNGIPASAPQLCVDYLSGEPASISVAGLIETEEGEAVEQVEVNLTGGMETSMMTVESGLYNFGELNRGMDYTVTPMKDDYHLNGASTLDLVLITKHILGSRRLTNPYQLIAADVNRSNEVSALDLIHLRKLILSIYREFPGNTSWRFIPKSYEFPDPENPWYEAFPEVLNYNDLQQTIANGDFVAVKVGDINRNAIPNRTVGDIRTISGVFELQVEDRQLKAGNAYRVTFRAEELAQIQGYQFTLNFERSALELVDLEYGVAREENFGLMYADEGVITTSWHSLSGDIPAEESLFTLVLRAREDANLSDLLSVSSRYTRAEAYNQMEETLDVKLDYGMNLVEAPFELRQNVPNPWLDRTMISFYLPQADMGTLTIHDVQGRVLQVIRGEYGAGEHQVELRRSELPTTGVLYYTLETSRHAATRKMIILE